MTAVLGLNSRQGMRTRRSESASAFTLIELLVVIAIIALLVSILLPSLSMARNLTKTAICGSNLHQLGVAINLYQADWAVDEPWLFTNGTTDGPGETWSRDYRSRPGLFGCDSGVLS